MSTIFSQQMLSGKLLQVIISRQKNNFNNKFNLKPITTYHLGFGGGYFRHFLGLGVFG